MGNQENILGLIQPQNDYPEIIQFFKMLTLPKAVLGYNREHVIDALRCLDGLYRNKIMELEERNKRSREFSQSQIKQKECAISQMEKKIRKNEIVAQYGDGQPADSCKQMDVITQVIHEIQQGLTLVIRKTAAQARQVCEDAQKQADEILAESRRKIKEEQLLHRQALARMAELKNQYLADLGALQAILGDMQEEADRFRKKLEDIQEKTAV